MHRSLTDPPPLPPESTGKSTAPIRLTPGMSGLMRLNLQEFRNVPLIPAGTVYTVGGNSYVLVIDNIKDNVGVTRRLTVRPLFNDGRMARVAVVVREGEPLRSIAGRRKS